MKTESQRIADQLRRSLTGPAWHGPAVLDLIGDITPEEAAARPLPFAHSIAEIVVHLSAWVMAADRALDTAVVAVDETGDWPSPGSWDDAVQALRDHVSHLASRVEALSDDELRSKVRTAETTYSRYVLLHGVAQHNIYHAGQLALLRKALRGA
jgi:uncharacterized damage-inducible protein DinB